METSWMNTKRNIYYDKLALGTLVGGGRLTLFRILTYFFYERSNSSLRTGPRSGIPRGESFRTHWAYQKYTSLAAVPA